MVARQDLSHLSEVYQSEMDLCETGPLSASCTARLPRTKIFSGFDVVALRLSLEAIGYLARGELLESATSLVVAVVGPQVLAGRHDGGDIRGLDLVDNLGRLPGNRDGYGATAPVGDTGEREDRVDPPVCVPQVHYPGELAALAAVGNIHEEGYPYNRSRLYILSWTPRSPAGTIPGRMARS